MMTTPRLVSLTALAASLFIVVLTITQANGLTTTAQPGVLPLACTDMVAPGDCESIGTASLVALQR